MTAGKTVQEQVKLPLGVALEVVMQGIRIRLGRSIVTLTGVICGIAFLMSVLTGQIIKKGVSTEDNLRREVVRMRNFMRADLPVLEDRLISLAVCGKLSEPEMRLLEQLESDFRIRGFEVEAGKPLALPRQLSTLKQVDGKAFASDSVALLVMGDAKDAAGLDFKSLIQKGTPKTLVTTLPAAGCQGVPAERLVSLSREMTQDEINQIEVKAQQDRFRDIWIVVVSLLVTVIGIANAMLMSVTERFREIGTMKCLGALSSFIRQIFLLESSIMGMCGGLAGMMAGAVFSFAAYSATYGCSLVTSSLEIGPLALYGMSSVFAGWLLSILAAVYPAQVASRMVPADALRSNV